MIEQGFVTPWALFTPVVFRMLERQYVDAFFETGELMLSSFNRFKAHNDEQRKDDEGRNIVTLRGENTTAYAVTFHGQNAWVLCGSAIAPTPQMLDRFGCDAAIQIFDTTGFAGAITKHVVGVMQGFEGHCMYSDHGIECKVPDVNIEQFRSLSGDGTLSLQQMGGYMLNVAGQSVYFRKKTSFKDQSEYRWVWVTANIYTDTVIIRVPEARQFCLPWYP